MNLQCGGSEMWRAALTQPEQKNENWRPRLNTSLFSAMHTPACFVNQAQARHEPPPRLCELVSGKIRDMELSSAPPPWLPKHPPPLLAPHTLHTTPPTLSFPTTSPTPSSSTFYLTRTSHNLHSIALPSPPSPPTIPTLPAGNPRHLTALVLPSLNAFLFLTNTSAQKAFGLYIKRLLTVSW